MSIPHPNEFTNFPDWLHEDFIRQKYTKIDNEIY